MVCISVARVVFNMVDQKACPLSKLVLPLSQDSVRMDWETHLLRSNCLAPNKTQISSSLLSGQRAQQRKSRCLESPSQLGLRSGGGADRGVHSPGWATSDDQTQVSTFPEGRAGERQGRGLGSEVLRLIPLQDFWKPSTFGDQAILSSTKELGAQKH